MRALLNSQDRQAKEENEQEANENGMMTAEGKRGENGEDRLTKHIDDPRLRGAYFMLANLMDMKDAESLREHLILHAAETKNHTVSDEFVKLLKRRQTLFDQGKVGEE